MDFIRGVPFYLHPEGEALSDHIRRENDFFEASILDYIKEKFPKQETILDIGANIGNHSLYFANFLEYRQILAFEPVPDNYVLLVQNCAYYNGFYAFRFALSDEQKLIRIQPNRGNMGASQVEPTGEIEVIAIPIDLLNLFDCTLIKIDVELHEPKVLLGALDTLERNKPLILIEDTQKEYEALLPAYECIMGWDEHRTYLYKWRGT